MSIVSDSVTPSPEPSAPPRILVVMEKTIRRWIQDENGFFEDPSGTLLAELFDQGAYMPRDAAEVDPNWKQLIPYVVINTPDGILLYQRTKKAGEQRLHGSYSIGFGGHIDEPEDLLSGLHREVFNEELVWPETGLGPNRGDLNQIGFIYINEGVHAVHLGVVFVLTIPNQIDLTTKDEGIILQGFTKLSNLALHFPKLEKWSQCLFSRLAVDPKYRY